MILNMGSEYIRREVPGNKQTIKKTSNNLVKTFEEVLRQLVPSIVFHSGWVRILRIDGADGNRSFGASTTVTASIFNSLMTNSGLHGFVFYNGGRIATHRGVGLADQHDVVSVS